MTESWTSVGIRPVPLLAPSFRIFGDYPYKVWTMWYALGASRVSQLDDRWVVDTTDVAQQEGIRHGDAISWIGDYVGGLGLYLWQPSRLATSQIRGWAMKGPTNRPKTQ